MRTLLSLVILAAAAFAGPYFDDRPRDDYRYYRPYASRPWSYYRHLNPYRARYSYRFMAHHGYGLNAAQIVDMALSTLGRETVEAPQRA